MKKEALIAKLQELPEGLEIRVLDYRKNLNESNDEWCDSGVYELSDVEVLGGTDDNHPEGSETTVPFISLSFTNDDYSEDGEALIN